MDFFCGTLLTDFIEWRYIHSWMVGIFDPACELLPPWTKEQYLCTVLVYCCPSTFSLTFPLPKLNVQYIQTVCGWGGGCVWGGGV
jgi:hypothetical protein